VAFAGAAAATAVFFLRIRAPEPGPLQ
jgi:hypothetical protein